MQAFPFDLFLAMQDNGLAEKRSVFLEFLYKSNYLYNWQRCDQTPPRRSEIDLKFICHFDPLLMQIDVSHRAF